VRRALETQDYRVLAELHEPSALHAETVRHAPDVIVVGTRSPDALLLEALQSIAEACPRPVVIFALDSSRKAIRTTVEAGAAAYVVDGWSAQRVSAIIDAACARFDAHQAVKKELEATRTKLSERKVIEKAKGIVMQQRGVTEDEAYGSLRKMAMDQNLALVEVARRVISVAQLLA
jgi:response regulator NasT